MYTAELLSELVKATTEEHPKRKKKDTNLYGTVVIYDGKTYVKIDGSDMLTPVFTTSEMNAGDRVVLKITDHNATVTGNITNPSASGKGIDDRILQVESDFEQKLDGFKMEVTGSFVSNDDLNTVKQELSDLADSKISEANQALRSDFTNLENRIQTSQSAFEQDFNSFKTTVAGTYLTKQEFEDSDVGSLSASISSLEQDLTGFKTTVAGTYVTSETHQADINNLNTDITELNTNFINAKKDIDANKTNIGTLQTSFSTLEQDLTGFRSTVASTYVTKDTYNDTNDTLTSAISGNASDIYSLTTRVSQVEQTADKISFIVASGDSASSMVLTDEFYSLVSDNITLTADKITVEGLTSVNENFKILLDGTCEVTDLVVTNSISVNNVSAEDFNIPYLTRSLNRDLTVYVNSTKTYDNPDYNLENENTFTSFKWI